MSKPLKHVVLNDRWDRQDLQRAIKENRDFRLARDRLARFVRTGKEALDDAFYVLFKVNPHMASALELDPTYIVNQAIIAAMADLPATNRLRAYTVGDAVQSAVACVSLERDLETLFDRFKEESKAAQVLQDLLDQLRSARQEAIEADHQLDEMVERWSRRPEPDEDLDQQVRAVVEAELAATTLQKQAEEQSAELDEMMAAQSATLLTMVRDALDGAADGANALQAAAAAWGLEPAEMQRLPAKQRLELARKLNTDRMRTIANLFGRMHNMVLSEQTSLADVPHELVDTEFGADLGRIVPSELLNLCNPYLRLDFSRRFIERSLLQYQMVGEERSGRGGIIFCEDGSGSMAGEPELFSKAVMLVLWHIAKKQGRPMHVVHYGSRGHVKHLAFERPEDFTFDRLIEAAEIFFGGGTDFVTPMEAAMEILQREYNATGTTRADVIFMTDDQCGVPADFMEKYLECMHRLSTTTWGICVSQMPPPPHGPLYQMSEGKVAIVKDLLSGSDVQNVFRSAAST